MRKLLFGTLLAWSTFFAYTANAREYVRGSASITDNGNGTHTLNCAADGLCAVIEGNTISIYVNGVFIRGTIIDKPPMTDNGDGTYSLQGDAVIVIGE